MGNTGRRSTIDRSGNGSPPSPPPSGSTGGDDGFDRDLLLIRLRTAAQEFGSLEKEQEVREVVATAVGGKEGAQGNFLLDTARSSFAGETVMPVGTGRMGMNHILGRHYHDFVGVGVVKAPQELFDFLMHGIRTGEVLSSRPASGAPGTNYTVETNWRSLPVRFQVTINLKGEVVQANPI